jgi:hypothetical protein
MQAHQRFGAGRTPDASGRRERGQLFGVGHIVEKIGE